MARRYRDDEDDEEDEDDDEPRRRRQPRRPSGMSVLPTLAMVAWGILLLAVTGGGLLFFLSISKAQGAVQEASLGAMFSTVFIGLYVAVRCVEKIISGLERRTNQTSGEPPDRRR